jgi:hypothetical protein
MGGGIRWISAIRFFLQSRNFHILWMFSKKNVFCNDLFFDVRTCVEGNVKKGLRLLSQKLEQCSNFWLTHYSASLSDFMKFNYIKIRGNFAKWCDSLRNSGDAFRKLCSAWNALQKEPTLVIGGVDTAENEPLKVSECAPWCRGPLNFRISAEFMEEFMEQLILKDRTHRVSNSFNGVAALFCMANWRPRIPSLAQWKMVIRLSPSNGFTREPFFVLLPKSRRPRILLHTEHRTFRCASLCRNITDFSGETWGSFKKNLVLNFRDGIPIWVFVSNINGIFNIPTLTSSVSNGDSTVDRAHWLSI